MQGGTDRSGLGLGLSICRRSVEANNGTLDVRDVRGTGCVLTISLPGQQLFEPCWIAHILSCPPADERCIPAFAVRLATC
jgi:hypothetical protein